MSEIINSEDGMRYLFLALVLLNMAVFGYYSFLRKSTESESVSQARAARSLCGCGQAQQDGAVRVKYDAGARASDLPRP